MTLLLAFYQTWTKSEKIEICLQKWPNFEAFDLEGQGKYNLDKGHFGHVSTYTSDL